MRKLETNFDCTIHLSYNSNFVEQTLVCQHEKKDEKSFCEGTLFYYSKFLWLTIHSGLDTSCWLQTDRNIFQNNNSNNFVMIVYKFRTNREPYFTHCYLTYTFNYRLVEHPMHIPWKACQERISTYQFWSQLESTPTPLLLLPHFQPWNAPYPIPKFTLPFQCLLEDIPSFWRLILRPIKMVRRMFCVVFSLEISNYRL